MVVGRFAGWILLILGLAVLGRDLIGWADTHRFEPEVLGQLWADLSRSSMDATEAVIRRFLSPRLWDPFIATLLQGWASAILGVLGLALLVLARRRDLPERWRR
jgi:ABC-type Fe3+ transport system permease subunit